MKIIKVKSDSVEIDISPSDIGILHFALYDYHTKISAELRKKKLDIPQKEDYKTIKGQVMHMIEMVNLLL